MMLPSHLLATVLGGLLLAKVRPWGAKEWALALGFGVAIDADHLLQIPRYVREHGVGALLDVRGTMAWGAEWQGFLHGPWAVVVVLAACFLARSEIPLLAWGLHMVLDFVVARHHVAFGSATEWAVVAGLAAVVAALLAHDHRLAGDASLASHLRARAATASSAVLALVR